MRPSTVRRLVLLAVALIAGVAAFRLAPEPLPELSRGELMAEIRDGNVHSIEIEDHDIILGESSTRGKFRSAFDRRRDSELPDRLRALAVAVSFTRSPPGI